MSPSLGHTHLAPKHKESTVLDSSAHTGGLGRGKDQKDCRTGLAPQELMGTRDCRIAASLESMNHGLS